MRVPESTFESYMSERILSFAYLMCPSVSGPKALKKRVCDLPYSISVKSYRTLIFQNRIKKYGVWRVFIQKSLSLKKYCERKNSQTRLCCLCFNLPTVKIWGNRTNSLWVLPFYSVRLKSKNWFEKTALNKSITRVIFTAGQNLKPPFVCQYLIFLKDLFFRLDHYFNRKIEIWKKSLIWRNTVTLIQLKIDYNEI